VNPRHAAHRPGVGAAWVAFGGVTLAVAGSFLLARYHPAEWVFAGLGAGIVAYGVRRWRGPGGRFPSQRWPPLGRGKTGGR
jgi:hypothetical protein